MDGREYSISFTKKELDFIYNQLLARKYHFEEDMLYWVESRDSKEVQRCSNAIQKIEKMHYKLINR